MARLAGVTCAAAVLVLTNGSPAFAAPVGTQFVPVPASVVWPATMADGTPQSSTVTVDTAEVAVGAELPGGVQLTPGQNYFFVALHPSYAYSIDPHTPFAMPTTPATLVTAQGTVTGIPVPPSSFAIDGSWYFPVPAGLTSATLQVASFTRVLGDDRGNFTQWSFNPVAIEFVAQPVASSAVPGAGPLGASSSPAAIGGKTNAPHGGIRGGDTGRKRGGGTPLGVVVGAGAVGAVVLGAAGAGLVSVMRRRAFRRADRAGRVVLTGPPVLAAAAMAARLHGSDVAGGAVVGGALPRTRHGIVVKILGWLEVEGTKEPITAGPLLELIVYLVLNPGRSFTSVQIRESVWVLGRQPITSATFRKYMVYLRKQFGPGVVVTDRFRYQLTDAVISDWDLFQAALTNDDHLAGQEGALALVRGPVLHGSFDGKKNSPFAWAYDEANSIEHRVTATAVELAGARLELDDAPRAARATAQGLLCANTNLELRKVDLLVGAALGGQREVGRRLDAARMVMADFPSDMTKLEELAGQLGWEAIVSG